MTGGCFHKAAQEFEDRSKLATAGGGGGWRGGEEKEKGEEVAREGVCEWGEKRGKRGERGNS